MNNGQGRMEEQVKSNGMRIENGDILPPTTSNEMRENRRVVDRKTQKRAKYYRVSTCEVASKVVFAKAVFGQVAVRNFVFHGLHRMCPLGVVQSRRHHPPPVS